MITYSHIVRPFDRTTWILGTLTVFLLATMQLIAYKIYQKPYCKTHNLSKPEEPWFNFYLFSFCKVTEPDCLPWFTKFSAGKLLTCLWMLLAMLLIFFYVSNLRAHFMIVKYEEPPTTLKHIVQRGQRVYIVEVAVALRYILIYSTRKIVLLPSTTVL